MLTDALNAIRLQGNQWLRGALVGDEAMKPEELASAGDLGLYGPSSIVWRVHADSSMLIGGLRALLLQTLHPLAMAGVADHSDYRDDPWGRLNRTGRFVGATTYGSTPTAEAAIATVHAVHERVKGTAPDGRAYSANDPHLLLWVHVTEVDSFLSAFDHYGEGKLRDGEKDQYVAEMAEVARRLGSEEPPTTVAELEACMATFRPECKAGDQAREAVQFLMAPPVPIWLRGSYRIVTAGAAALLPSWARAELRLPLPPLAAPLVVHPAATTFTRAVGWLMSARTSEGTVRDRLRPTVTADRGSQGGEST